jgi:hypothetical protein
LALLPALLGALLFIFSWTRHAPPEFSATISRFDGLDSSHRAEGPPSFGVNFRATNRNMWQFCFKPSNDSAVEVAYAGVPLSRADLPAFCVPGRGVAKVRAVATGEGLGMPDALYRRMEAQRQKRERVPLTVHVRLEEYRVLRHNLQSWPPVLLWCEAMLPPNGPSPCLSLLVEN